jgi:hypothetical protein
LLFLLAERYLCEAARVIDVEWGIANDMLNECLLFNVTEMVICYTQPVRRLRLLWNRH